MSQLFSKIRIGNSKRSTFDLSHNQVTTADFGQLIPICYRDMLPNDDFTVTPEAFVRLAPAATPFYGSIKVRIHHFFVPYRLCFGSWDAFISQSPSNFEVPPYFTVAQLRSALEDDPQYSKDTTSGYKRGIYCKLMSNLGLNPQIFTSSLGDSNRIAAFPFLAYYRIWLDYFLDSNINDHSALDQAFKTMVEHGGSLDAYVHDLLQYRNCCFKKDYFTTAKLSPQEGSPSRVGVDVADPDLNIGLSGSSIFTNLQLKGSNRQVSASGSSSAQQSSATSKLGQFAIEALRGAVSAQRYSERNNYVGSKIINRILAHFGIAPSAERLDMAEFLGSESFPIAVQDVTSHNTVSDLQDNYTTLGLGMQAGKGLGRNGRPSSVHYHAKEHGIFMTVMSILPDTAYYQGISKFWTKGVTGEPLDYFTPEFENLGYQEILNQELYCPSIDDQVAAYQSYDPKGVFGYTPRFSEYKFAYDILGSDFVSPGNQIAQGNYGAYMDAWHLFRKLNYSEQNPLALNNNFVTCDNTQEDFDRVFQYTDNKFDHFYFNIRVDVKATRNMVGFAEPSIDATNMLGDGNTINLPYGGTRL